MIVIKRIRNEENLHYYLFENLEGIHNKLINFLHGAGFDDDACNEIDTPFLELNGECLFVKKDNLKIHFFIFDNKTWMIIDSLESQENLVKLMKDHFSFPK